MYFKFAVYMQLACLAEGHANIHTQVFIMYLKILATMTQNIFSLITDTNKDY
jgi:hypothetical protein